jgi:hypothetical protein
MVFCGEFVNRTIDGLYLNVNKRIRLGNSQNVAVQKVGS